MFFKYDSIILTLKNHQSNSINLNWSFHQGFPLTPSLFILIAKAFGYLLAYKIEQGSIRGIAFPNSDHQVVNGHFVDESFFIVREEKPLTI